MAAIPGTNVAAPIRPYDDQDTIFTFLDTEGKGGFRVVNDLTERDSIPEPRQKVGMEVKVLSNNLRYSLNSTATVLTSSNWTLSTTSNISGSFLDLSDTPITYVGESLKYVRVKSDETGLEFATISGGVTESYVQLASSNSYIQSQVYTNTVVANTAGSLQSQINTLGTTIVSATGSTLSQSQTYANSTSANSYAQSIALIPTTINDLSDVIITSPTSGQILTYNGTNWINLDNSTSGSGTGFIPLEGTGVVITSSGSNYVFSTIIGPSEDGDYTDGLFTDLTDTTPVGVPIDRFNEVLKALAPSPAPLLDNISISNTGVAGKLSFGVSNIIAGYTNVPTKDINSTVSTSETINDGGDSVTLIGIFNATTTISGVLNDDVPIGSGTPTAAYPANSFGDGDSGLVQLWINGSQIVSIDLSSTTSGISTTVSGATLIVSASQPVSFPNGTTFPIFTYRTGTWSIASAGQRNGYNKIEVRRVLSSTTRSNSYGWIVDGSTTATTYAGEALSGLIMAGSKYLSGINYHTGGTATYSITASNVHKNTYSSSGSSVTHSGTRCTVSSSSLGNISTENDTEILSKTATVSTASRILNQNIGATTTIDRTVQSDTASTGTTNYALLLDNTSQSSTSTYDGLDDEVFRVPSSISTTTTTGYNSTGSSPTEWDTTISLVSGTSGYSGLLVENSSLKYPTQGTNGGNFGGITNGPANPNYSSASGNRTYLRYFYDSNPRQNFRLNVTASSTSFVSVATGPSSNNLTMEILAPNTTTDGITLGVWKDATVAYTNDNSIGCYASSNGATIPTSWGLTLGGKNTSTSGYVILIRITSSSSWTGSISAISLTWL